MAARKTTAVAVSSVIALGFLATQHLPNQHDINRPHAPTSPSSSSPPAPSASGDLDNLTVTSRPPTSDPTYRREAFGNRWTDVDGNGCNQRDDVLLRDGVPGTVITAQQGSCPHDVLAGTWVDPYSSISITLTAAKDPAQSQLVVIDHIVPLAEAWASGARDWTDQQRLTYANDLAVLLAVDGATNSSKGKHDPAAWRPTKNYQCTYAHQWIAIKTAYALTIDQPEKDALLDMLTYCSP